MEDDLPYRAEYAKSGRASCKGCKSNIAKDTLRLAVLVQSPAFDGKVPQWYHQTCFFGKQRPKTVDDIQHFESLRWEDQEKIKEKIKNLGTIVVPEAKGKGKKRASTASAASGALQDFRIEIAKSGRAGCRGCEQKILKDEVRIAKKDFTTDIGKKYGGQDMWHHLSCFAKLRTELCFFAGGDCLPGYNSLTKANKDEVKKQLPPIKQEEPEAKKIKKEEEDEVDENADKLKAESKKIFKYRDLLKANLKKDDLRYLLEANDQEIPAGDETMLDRLADLMTFGTLLPCSKCNGGQLIFNKFGYECHGDLTDWTKCSEVYKEPPRKKFVVPKELAGEHSFLKKYKCVLGTRIIRNVKPTTVPKKEEDETDSKPKVERERPPLYNMEFVLINVDHKDKLKKDITKLGGKVVTKISETVMAVISNEDSVEKMGARITSAKDADVHVLPEGFVKKASKKKYDEMFKFIEEQSICDWGSDPAKRIPEEPIHKSGKSKSIYTKSVPKSMTMKLKGGTAVDPDSGLEDCAHVYISGEDKYTVVLGLTDLEKQKNSYYKLQLLQSDTGGVFWVFRAWGRTGTTIGNNKVEKMSNLIEAKRHFCALYTDKTGNEWDMRHDFQKVPGRMYPIDVDYTDETDNFKIDNDAPSTLAVPVQKLIKMIFNIDDMKRVMLEFELDTEKMPLGKLSKAQIKKAYGVLTELQAMISASERNERMFVDASNRFYTYVPHSAGVDALPILQTEDQIKQKIDMMDNLMELEIAYNLMKSSASGSVDAHYEQLKSEIGVLERDSAEFEIIQEYVKNTHAPTHDAYELVITEVFTVKRQGEEKRFKPFRKLHNRQLLWHGSRVTNFAGIISQGLRIAPPEAPVTGYMFGKGVYFADMVTKSANYCCTSPANNTGLLLLCDVALGDMMELKEAKMVTKLPSGKHSCKGLGMTCPDPGLTKKIGDVNVPLGKPTKVKNKSSLLYNEYIVYDVAQVNIRYLVQTEFKYKKY